MVAKKEITELIWCSIQLHVGYGKIEECSRTVKTDGQSGSERES